MILGITLGDVGGIGPEITLKAVYARKWPKKARFVVVGGKAAVAEQARLLSLPEPPAWTPETGSPAARVSLWDPLPANKSPVLCPGRMRVSSGAAAAAWIRAAAGECMAGRFDGFVTAPICKKTFSVFADGCPGHTEYIAMLTGSKKPVMMLMGGGLRVVLVTTHMALRQVPDAVTEKAVVETCLVAAQAMQWMGLKGKLALCALNPHAGEAGALGCEEKSIITPAARKVKRKGIPVEGPLPADVVFHQALKGRYDVVVAMYHDQGLAPLKTVGFETGVNLTLGIPVVRTSPDHGTAFDIAGKGVASPDSMVAAIKHAVLLAARPNPWRENTE